MRDLLTIDARDSRSPVFRILVLRLKTNGFGDREPLPMTGRGLEDLVKRYAELAKAEDVSCHEP